MNGDYICSMFVPSHYYVCIQTISPQNFNITTGSPKLKRNRWQRDKIGTGQEDVYFSVFPGDIVLKIMSWLPRHEVSILPCCQVENTTGRVCLPSFLLATGQARNRPVGAAILKSQSTRLDSTRQEKWNFSEFS